MNTQHTQGPWAIRKGEVCYISKEDDQSFGMWCPVSIEDEANASLIAAAPELLAALKYALEALDDLRVRATIQSMAITAARAAIAKATGK